MIWLIVANALFLILGYALGILHAREIYRKNEAMQKRISLEIDRLHK